MEEKTRSLVFFLLWSFLIASVILLLFIRSRIASVSRHAAPSLSPHQHIHRHHTCVCPIRVQFSNLTAPIHRLIHGSDNDPNRQSLCD